MNELYQLILIDEMREHRNELLKESDFRVLPDNVKNKDLWIEYRQKLRDLPETWVKDMDFPLEPI